MCILNFLNLDFCVKWCILKKKKIKTDTSDHARAISKFQERWDQSGIGRMTYESFPHVCTRRLQSDTST